MSTHITEVGRWPELSCGECTAEVPLDKIGDKLVTMSAVLLCSECWAKLRAHLDVLHEDMFLDLRESDDEDQERRCFCVSDDLGR